MATFSSAVNSGEQIVKLPHNPISGCENPRRHRPPANATASWRSLYVTLRSTFKSSEDMQQGTLARTRFADDGEHFSLPHCEGQVLKAPGPTRLSERPSSNFRPATRVFSD